MKEIKKLKSYLPFFYQKFYSKKILDIEIHESKADCNRCNMARPLYKGKYPYDKDLKCCTYQPFLPNYIVGAILESQDTKAIQFIKKTLEEAHNNHKSKIADPNKSLCLPIGILPSITYQVNFNQRELGEFGNRKEWLCPYYDKENSCCGIWIYRSSVCTGYYCKSSYGKNGILFWKKFVEFQFFVESALMEECLTYLDFSPRQVTELLEYINIKKMPKVKLTQSLFLKLWNFYYHEDVNDQILFYIKCWQIVKKLNRKTFKEYIGEWGIKLENQLLNANENLDRK